MGQSQSPLPECIHVSITTGAECVTSVILTIVGGFFFALFGGVIFFARQKTTGNKHDPVKSSVNTPAEANIEKQKTTEDPLGAVETADNRACECAAKTTLTKLQDRVAALDHETYEAMKILRQGIDSDFLELEEYLRLRDKKFGGDLGQVRNMIQERLEEFEISQEANERHAENVKRNITNMYKDIARRTEDFVTAIRQNIEIVDTTGRVQKNALERLAKLHLRDLNNEAILCHSHVSDYFTAQRSELESDFGNQFEELGCYVMRKFLSLEEFLETEVAMLKALKDREKNPEDPAKDEAVQNRLENLEDLVSELT
ncbi:Fc.00g107460.m01.CDS01 [Cosmosporella sp. VM-42]